MALLLNNPEISKNNLNDTDLNKILKHQFKTLQIQPLVD